MVCIEFGQIKEKQQQKHITKKTESSQSPSEPSSESLRGTIDTKSKEPVLAETLRGYSMAKARKTKLTHSNNISNTEPQSPSEASTSFRVPLSLGGGTSIDEAIRLSVFTTGIMALSCYGWRVGVVEYKMRCNRIRYNRTRCAPTVTLPYLTLPYLTLPYLTLPYLSLINS